MLFRDATIDDLEAIEDLLEDANDTPYDLARVAREKCFGEGPHGPPRTIVAATGPLLEGIITFAPRSVRLLAVRRDSRRRGIGSSLLAQFEESAGPGRAAIYGEAGNYFLPGVPEDDSGTRRFFERHGYAEEPERAENLHVDLAAIGEPEAGGTPAPHRVRPADRAALLEFVASHFGKLWSYEVARALASDPPSVFIARDPAGSIAGFSAHEANNQGLGFFGPMGTDPATRGRGVGRALLLASLADLRARGFSTAVISWAANLPFYERACGARPSLRMVRFSKVLP